MQVGLEQIRSGVILQHNCEKNKMTLTDFTGCENSCALSFYFRDEADGGEGKGWLEGGGEELGRHRWRQGKSMLLAMRNMMIGVRMKNDKRQEEGIAWKALHGTCGDAKKIEEK